MLGTLSVLRSNALGTGWSIVSALAGTAVGIVVGALLVIGIGTHEAVLWGVLPVAVFLAAYAPRAISFAAGQAGFTVVLFVLFNIIQPVGWSVGLVRVEDVAIGFAISLVVGLLFWPRGAAALLRDELATAYARGADYVVATARRLIEGGSERRRPRRRAPRTPPSTGSTTRFGSTSPSAPRRQYNVEDVAALVGGASRVRRAAQSLAALGRMTDGNTRARALRRATSTASSTRSSRGTSRSDTRSSSDARCRRRTSATPRAAAGCSPACATRRAADDKATVNAALVLLWASQHLDNLWRLEAHLAERANASRAAATAAE